MRRFSALLLAPVLVVLLAVTVLVACGGDGDSATRGQAPTSSEPSTSSIPSTRSTQQTTSTRAEPDVVASAEPADASTGPVSPPAAPTPRPSDDACDTAVVHDAIASSDAVADDMTFEITYLECAEGYGWAQILADFGDGATVFFEGSGSDIALLDLGSSVCPTAVGMPAGIATQLAPPGSRWLEECGF